MISDFETGTLEGWDIASGSPTLEVVAGGPGDSAWALEVTVLDEDYSQILVDLADWSALAAENAILFDMLVPSTAEKLDVNPALNSAIGGWVDTGWIGVDNIDKSGTWVTYQWDYPGQPASPGSYGQLFLSLWEDTTDDSSTTFYIDNVRVVPEPATLGTLMLLGGVVLGRRRR
jgi:hypothetical protein